MSKFKIGDEVITNSFLSKSILFAPDMLEFCCKKGIINYIYPNGAYSVHGWSWPENSLILVKEEQMNKMPELQTGNRVVYRNGKVFVYIKDLEGLYTLSGFMDLEDTDTETGKIVGGYNDGWDILQVYDGFTNGNMLDFNDLGNLLWEYKEPAVPTEADLLREQIKELKGKLRELGEE